MEKANFNKSAQKEQKRPSGKFLRLTDDLNDRINNECSYLGITRNAWITMTLDRELRNAAIERSMEIKYKITHSQEDVSLSNG